MVAGAVTGRWKSDWEAMSCGNEPVEGPLGAGRSSWQG